MRRVPRYIWIGLAVIVIAIIIAAGAIYYPQLQDDRAFSNAEQKAQAAGSDSQKALDAFQEYLSQYPDGNHADETKKKEQELEQKIDDEFFAQASKQAEDTGSDSQMAIKAYQSYLDTYPQGAHVKDSRQKISELQALEQQRAQAQSAFAAGASIYIFDPRAEGRASLSADEYSVAYILAPGVSTFTGAVWKQTIDSNGTSQFAGSPDNLSLKNNTGRLTFTVMRDQTNDPVSNAALQDFLPGYVPATIVSIEVLISASESQTQTVSNLLSIPI